MKNAPMDLQTTVSSLIRLKFDLEDNAGDLTYYFENCVSEADLMRLIDAAIAHTSEYKFQQEWDAETKQLEQEARRSA